jgi:hypothetical protein
MSVKTFLSRSCVLAALLLPASMATAQQGVLTCQTLSAPLTVRAEGKTERVGNITINCSGGTPGAQLSTGLTVFLDRSITNRTTDNITFRDIVLSVDQGNGLNGVSSQATRNGSSSASFNNVPFTVPPSGRVAFMISGLRANVSSSQGAVTAFLSVNGVAGLTLNTNATIVAQPQTGLFTTGTATPIDCGFSVLPSLSFDEAIQERTFSFSARLTEGFTAAFTPREPGADTGVRFIARYTGFPSTAKLYVPDVISGSSANVPTSAGDLGRTASAGQYTPGSLLLVRILGTDASGAGGFPAAGGQPLPFGSLHEVALTSGAGIAVYEVVDSNAALRESAQVPTFLDMRTVPSNTSTVAMLNVTFGPVDEVSVVRFASLTPGTDCSVLGDCGAGYFPQLTVDTTPISATATAGSGYQVKYITIRNEGTGYLVWNARVSYTNGADWIRLERPSGVNNSTLRADLLPEKVPGPGTYQATIVVDAGPNGTRTVPVTFTVQAAAAPPGPAVSSVTSAGITNDEAVVPGGQAVVKGTRLGGRDVQVTFGGVASRLVYNGPNEIHLEVPNALAGRSAADLVVNVDGSASVARAVKLKSVMPAIFPGGVVNEGWTENSASQPAVIGTTLKVFFTGIPESQLSTATVRMHDWAGLRPTAAAAMADNPGVSYVDVEVPLGIPAITSDLVVCAQGAEGPVCSAPVKVTLAN